MQQLFRPSPSKRVFFFIIFDILISLFTLTLSYNLRFNFNVENEYYKSFALIATVLILCKIISFFYFKIYQIAWRYFSLNEAKRLFYAHLSSYLLFLIIYYVHPSPFNPFPRSVIIIDLFLSMLFIGLLRVLKRLFTEGIGDVKNKKRAIVIGVTSFAQTFLKENKEYHIRAIADENEMIINTYLSDIRVSNIKDIEKIIKNEQISTAIITKKYDKNTLSNLIEQLHSLSIKDIKIVSIENDNKLKPLSIEDLLARRPKDLDKKTIGDFIKNKTILITGAGGSIGSELSRLCLKFKAKKLLLLDHSEYNLYKIEQELQNYDIEPILLTLLDKEALERIFQTNDIEIVLHAAAYKHVPLVEQNIEEAIKNNIVGTKNIIDLSILYGVKKFVLISTDKAVRPTNVMGATKRVCELYGQNVKSGKTEIVSVRFGNVLGSSGSVIPKFNEQIAKGGPITVTHPKITRYFMLISEACELVLQAASIAKGGEIFILDMGEPVKIVDLAKKMCELSGKSDIQIKFTGLRPGEKLFEELISDDKESSTKYDSIMVAQKTIYDIKTLNQDIKKLLDAENKIDILKKIVPEFTHK